MSKTRTKEIIVCVITLIVLVLSMVTNVFATGIMDALSNNSNNSNSSNSNSLNGQATNNSATNTQVDAIASQNNNNNTNRNTNTNANTNKNNVTAIPNTGVDYSALVIIAICGVSAIYAYKKIRDYKEV